MSNDMNHHIKIYRNVFIGLLIFTGLTVGASYIDFNLIWIGVTVGLSIAFFKGYLVAANFMHLNDEKKLIYMILGMTIFFFVVLFFMPTLWNSNELKSPDYLPIQNGEGINKIDHNNNHSHGDHH